AEDGIRVDLVTGVQTCALPIFFVDDTLTAQTSVNTIVLPLPSGPHTIRLQLVTDNGSALNPDVTASVSVMVTRGPAGGAPGLSRSEERRVGKERRYRWWRETEA